ncbi:MAG: phosphodiesterase [Ruminococcaceae bacterium]|nr:phosphodiesterase [Oscillospiraceae bacterium]
MKILIASDLHGSACYTRMLVDSFNASGAEMLVLLGDILYHGPRNDLPREYAPKAVIEMLNPLADRIIAVRGNCESEVDQMVLQFPVTPDYGVIAVDGLKMYLSHGHREAPKMTAGSVYLTGHTHVPLKEDWENGCIHLNPGSVSIPKEDSPHSYLLYENGIFTWHRVRNNKEYMQYVIR